MDASGLAFIDPFGLTILGSSFVELREWNQQAVITGLNQDMGGYLERMDLFRGVELPDCETRQSHRHDRRDSLVELTAIHSVQEAHTAAPRLARTLTGADPESALVSHDGMRYEDPGLTLSQNLGYVLGELLENALTHARRHGFTGAKVWVAGQYYPSRDTVRLAVTDTGCGFLSTLESHPNLVEHNHHGAILTAMQPRVSCNRDVGILADSINEGVGLTTTVRIAEAAGGRAFLVSGDGYHSTMGGTGAFSSGAHWQGVSIALEIPRGGLLGINIRDHLPPREGAARVSLRFE
ncbi:MAG: ATP-binding protein [Gammaproteobacteria bacterium]